MAARRSKALLTSKPRATREDGGGAPALVWGDFRDRHRKRPLMLLHGLPQRPDVFDPLAGRLARMGFLPIAPYLYGHLYKRPEAPATYQLARFLGNALAAADRFQLKDFEVLGIGLGAAVGWMLAGGYPERVRALASIQFPHPAAFAAQWDLPPRLRHDTPWVLPKEAALLTERQVRARKSLMRHLLVGQGLPRLHVNPYADRLSSPGALEVAMAWNAPQPPQELPLLHVPVLFVSNSGGHAGSPGRVEQLVPPRLARRAWLNETQFPLESASTELIGLLEHYLQPH